MRTKMTPEQRRSRAKECRELRLKEMDRLPCAFLEAHDYYARYTYMIEIEAGILGCLVVKRRKWGEEGKRCGPWEKLVEFPLYTGVQELGLLIRALTRRYNDQIHSANQVAQQAHLDDLREVC